MRWLSRSTGAPTYRSLVSRLGYITNNGVSLETASATADILKCISSEWRDLIAGAEGYLTAKDRRGISGRMVDWGDMVRWEFLKNEDWSLIIIIRIPWYELKLIHTSTMH